MNPQYVALALLVFALVATRLWEEEQWRRGRFSDQTAAILVVGRLPVLAFGFAVLTGQPLPTVLVMTAIALVMAAAVYPFVVGRRAPHGRSRLGARRRCAGPAGAGASMPGRAPRGRPRARRRQRR